MFETKSMRPYYSVAHHQISESFKDLTGFAYKYHVDIVSSEMNNESYHTEEEMAESTKFFRKIWENNLLVKNILNDIKETFKRSMEAEKYGWTQKWKTKSDLQLVKDMNIFYNLMSKAMTRTVISQPQHVLPLDQKLNTLLDEYPNKDELLLAATYYSGNLPWIDENKEIEELNKKWSVLSEEEKSNHLKLLVEKYGWFNDIEGDKPFDQGHYRKKIEEFKPEKELHITAAVPENAKEVGQLVGELGFLRFWGRYHFMTLRYHLKNIIKELTIRSKNPDLEFATVDEIEKFFNDKEIDWSYILARKNGYAVYLVDGTSKIAVGKEFEEIKRLVNEPIFHNNEIKGLIANKGKVVGKVRVISFTANDYNEQVSAFKDGEILVTGMTRPQIVHLCKKASAIITDEGGITSHAAVISREFSIPCIIATHNATRILKTGNTVEVDANIGIVRVLK